MTNKEKKQPQQIPASWKKSIFSNGRIYKKKDFTFHNVCHAGKNKNLTEVQT